jgi:hypothetical protein
MSKGLTFITGFGWQKALDLNSTTSFSSNANTHPQGLVDRDYGYADFHRTARLTGSFNYALPSLSKSRGLGYLVNGWQANSIITLQTGPPLTVRAGVDNAFSGINIDRVDLAGDPKLDGGRPRGEQIARWFNTAAYRDNAPGTFGTLGRNTQIGPGTANVDFSMFKSFKMPFRESHTLEFRGEFFNVFNRPNLNPPNVTRTSNLFGVITSAADPRILQSGLRYAF